MRITDTHVIIDLEELVQIARTYNRTDPADLRRRDPTKFMLGVWLGWLFAHNPELAPYIPNITQIRIERPEGWEPGDIIPGEPDPLPTISLDLDTTGLGFPLDVPLLTLTTDADGRLDLPERLRQIDDFGSAIADTIQRLMGKPKRKRKRRR